MKTVWIRLVSGLFGAIAALIAIWVPLIFIVSEINESRSYDGPISIPGAVGGSLLILAISTLFGFAAYKLLMRAAGKYPPQNGADYGSGENFPR